MPCYILTDIDLKCQAFIYHGFLIFRILSEFFTAIAKLAIAKAFTQKIIDIRLFDNFSDFAKHKNIGQAFPAFPFPHGLRAYADQPRKLRLRKPFRPSAVRYAFPDNVIIRHPPHPQSQSSPQVQSQSPSHPHPQEHFFVSILCALLAYIIPQTATQKQ